MTAARLLARIIITHTQQQQQQHMHDDEDDENARQNTARLALGLSLFLVLGKAGKCSERVDSTTTRWTGSTEELKALCFEKPSA